MVIWVIGISGAGKSTFAGEVVRLAKKVKSNVVHIDGDVVRAAFNHDLGFTPIDRLTNAKRISQICKLLDDQGIHVVCSVLSLFQETRDWNRSNIKNYYEIFIDATLAAVAQRDYKGIYKKYENETIKNVVGLDIKFQKPLNSDLTISNDGSLDVLLDQSKKIVDLIVGAS